MEESKETFISLYIALTSLLISILALIYTVKTFYLKKWDKYRIVHSSISSSVAASNSHIASLTIQNLKDKPLIISWIHLKFWHNIFLEIQKFRDKPYIIPALEAHQFNYEHVIHYSTGLNRVNINKLFEYKKIKQKFLLETVETQWFILGRFFKNYFTLIIHPERFSLAGKCFGDNVHYIINFDNNEKLIPLYTGNSSFSNRIKIPEELLINTHKIKEHILYLKDKGELEFSNFDVIDWRNLIKEQLRWSSFEQDAKDINETATFIEYYMLGLIYTKIKNIRTKLINSKVYKSYKMLIQIYRNK